MPTCPNRTTCAFTNNISMKEALRVWQSFYCDGAFGRCERHKLTAAGAVVPPLLMPNGRFQEVGEHPAPADPPLPSKGRAA